MEKKAGPPRAAGSQLISGPQQLTRMIKGSATASCFIQVLLLHYNFHLASSTIISVDTFTHSSSNISEKRAGLREKSRTQRKEPDSEKRAGLREKSRTQRQEPDSEKRAGLREKSRTQRKEPDSVLDSVLPEKRAGLRNGLSASFFIKFSTDSQTDSQTVRQTVSHFYWMSPSAL
ncbi:uncharacterized protein V6R79_019835 [Siganus canaliculatus]